MFVWASFAGAMKGVDRCVFCVVVSGRVDFMGLDGK